MAREVTLLLHFIGLGLLMTTLVAGFILNAHYKKATDAQSKALIVKALKSVGLMSPLGMFIMLVTGIANMISRGFGLFTDGRLTAKIIFFAIAMISGILFAVKSRKRGALVHQMAQGQAQPDSEQLLQSYDKQISIFYIVMPLLLLIILYLSVMGHVALVQQLSAQ
ncbi:MAG: hypothetical protein HY707_09080 [Ignavibacteriae bacterium]|nr:hypothetical protein [Ignavibacteriota bacterium]